MHSEDVFQTIPEWAQFSQGGQRKRKKKKHGKLAWKFPWKSCSTTHLTLFSTNPGKILKPFPKSFPTELKSAIAQQKTKKMRLEKWKKRAGGKGKEKSWDCCVIFKPKNYFGILLSKLIFYIWIRRPQSVRPINCFVVSFSPLYSQTEKNISTGFKMSFWAKFSGVNGKNLSRMVP